MSDAERYWQENGLEALERQRAEAENRFACCGELKSAGHHSACRNFEEPTVPEHIDGQESLL